MTRKYAKLYPEEWGNVGAIHREARGLAVRAAALKERSQEKQAAGYYDKAEELLNYGVERYRRSPDRLRYLLPCLIYDVLVPQDKFAKAEELVVNVIISFRHNPQKTHFFFSLLRTLICSIQGRPSSDYHKIAIGATEAKPPKRSDAAVTVNTASEKKKKRPAPPVPRLNKHGLPELF